MKRLTISVLTVFLALLVTAPPVAAEEKKALTDGVMVKVAIINIDKIMRLAKVAKNIREQHKTFRTDFQKTIQKEEEELHTANQELARKRSLLSPEAFTEERRKFEERLMEVQRKVQERSHSLEKAQNAAMKKVQAALQQIVVDIAQEHKLTLIVNSKQVVFHHNSLDITPVALKHLDEKLPAVKFAFDKGSE